MLSRPYLRADNRAVLSVLNDCLVREFLKLLSILHKSTAVTTNVCLVTDNHSMLSQMLCSFSHEMTYALSRHRNEARVSADQTCVSGDQSGVNVSADKLCCKLLAWLPHVTHICRSLLSSDSVSQFASA